MNAALALLASLLWGGADFGGGRLSQGRSAVVVLARTQSFAVLALLVALAVRGGIPVGRYLLYGIAAGCIGPVALACYYRALAIGPMGLVSPAAATGGVVPVVVGVLQGDRVTGARAAGIVLALIGAVVVATVSGAPAEAGSGSPRRGVLIALASGVGFGAIYPLLAAGGHHDVLGTLLMQRGLGTALLLVAAASLARRRPAGSAVERVTLRGWGVFALVGLSDLAANACFTLSSRTGALAVVGTLGSLYPVVTAVSAGWVLHERLTRTQLGGAALAFAGVLLLSS